MQIRIEIDLKPEELRTFLGLPDVAGIQEDLINFARDKIGHGIEGFDPATFVRENVDAIRGTKAWQRLINVAFGADEDVEPEPPPKRKRRSPAKKAGSQRS